MAHALSHGTPKLMKLSNFIGLLLLLSAPCHVCRRRQLSFNLHVGRFALTGLSGLPTITALHFWATFWNWNKFAL